MKASLKHLTFKTVFLPALALGKRRSEIHTWVNMNIRHREDWLMRVQIMWLHWLSLPWLPHCTSLSWKIGLCAVRALRNFLNRTKDLRDNKQLVFVCVCGGGGGFQEEF